MIPLRRFWQSRAHNAARKAVLGTNTLEQGQSWAFPGREDFREERPADERE
jgi:hypothetical protein